ncbi:tRNA 2-thiouridine(34) synthase MnmA [Patescibacteria group bacterium]|nr:tRNA 2-thiouridine(34) synthase MnmA [Patescibacteria group bacterium]
MKRLKEKVICAMSGGIDSSVAAALLKRAGFDVVGIFMKFWSEPVEDGLIGAWNRCCSPEAEKRAGKVASYLSIPFYVYRFEKEFKKRIVDYFLKEHKAGRTPNPCVICNKEIKFGILLEKALALEADYVATGHYARLRREIPTPKSQTPNYKLLRAKDKGKDQSYFLWQLNQKQLKHILFPIGDYTKDEVRKLAKKFELPVLNIPESMEICFISTTINDFLKRYLKSKPGPIVEPRTKASFIRNRQVHYRARKIVGQHQGLYFYTIGQRKGIGLPGGPYYVLDKDIKRNLLIVTKNDKDLYKKELIAKNINWISGKEPELPLKIKAKIRYRHRPASATIIKKLKAKTYRLIFDKPQRAVTPGQSAVFFKGQELLGGGIISKL